MRLKRVLWGKLLRFAATEFIRNINGVRDAHSEREYVKRYRGCVLHLPSRIDKFRFERTLARTNALLSDQLRTHTGRLSVRTRKCCSLQRLLYTD